MVTLQREDNADTEAFISNYEARQSAVTTEVPEPEPQTEEPEYDPDFDDPSPEQNQAPNTPVSPLLAEPPTPVIESTTAEQTPQFNTQDRQRLLEYEQELVQLRQQQENARLEGELRQYFTNLTNQGFSEADVEALTREKAQNLHERVSLQRRHQADIQEIQSKQTVSQIFAEQFKDTGLSQADFMKANSPQEMENMGLKAQVAKYRQAQPATTPRNAPPSQFDSNRAAPNATASRERRLAQLNALERPWSEEEFQEVGRLRQQY